MDENSCESCHSPHTAGGHDRLLNYAPEEDNCLTCHNGNVAATDIENEILKTTSRHAPQDYFAIHDPIEDFTMTVTNHVECVDCHNPHRANDTTASAPNVPGPLLGVSGITALNAAIEEVNAGYEVCFKCHADNNVTTTAPVAREYPEINTRLEFDISNPSFHPIEAAGNNPDVPSLLSPYTTGSIITCWDCHNNDDGPGAGGSGPNGPHGSRNDFLLERNYNMIDRTAESPTEYALCYKCHDRDSILNDDSFKEHDRHIRRTPCSVCHDPHGISSAQGNATNNSHLINFDLTVVQPNNNGELRFEDTGLFSGRCYMRCHNNNHSPREYP